MLQLCLIVSNRSDKARSFRDEDSEDDNNPEILYPPPPHSTRSSCKKCEVGSNWHTCLSFDSNKYLVNVLDCTCTFILIAEPCPSAQ